MEISEDLIGYFKKEMSVTVDASTRLVDDGIIDSMGVVGLLEYVSGKYDIEFDAEDMTVSNLESVTALSALVQSKL